MVAQVSCAVGLTEESSRIGRKERRRSGGKKKRVTPAPLFISWGCGRGRGVVLHYPDRYCNHRHVVAHRGAAVPVTVPLGQLWAVIAL
jgi:hypothetical protein